MRYTAEPMAAVTLAFLHYLFAFVLVGALMVELVLLRDAPSVATVRTLLRMDSVYGAAAGLLLVVGFLRVFYTEKGAAYYFHSGAFIAKIALFVGAKRSLSNKRRSWTTASAARCGSSCISS
jgi:uncharacterized membrane protein